MTVETSPWTSNDSHFLLFFQTLGSLQVKAKLYLWKDDIRGSDIVSHSVSHSQEMQQLKPKSQITSSFKDFSFH